MNDATQVSLWQILLVDDDQDDYFLVRSMLSEAKQRKVHLDWAQTFDSGQSALKEKRYDVVLVDYDLGLHNGLELIREATDDGYPGPFILYTGRGSYEVDVEAMQAGASMYLTKGETSALMLERGIRYAIERKQNEQALANANAALAHANTQLSVQKRELDRQLQERSHILESIQDNFFSVDQEWNITYINRKAALHTARTPAELIGRNLWEAFPKIVGSETERQYRQAMEEHCALQFEAQGIYQNRMLNINIYPSAEGISVFSQDISERKKAERALEDSRQEQIRLASFPELNPNPILEIELSGRLRYINPHAKKLFSDLYEKGTAHPFLAGWEDLKAQLRKEPRKHWVREIEVEGCFYQQSMYYYQDYELIRIYGMDITQRMQAEKRLEAARAEALREKQRLEAVMEVLPVGVAITDEVGGGIQANPAYEQVWGGTVRPASSVADYTAYQAWWADSGEPLAPEEWASAKAVETGEAVYGQILEIQRFDGKRGYVINSAAPVRDAAGKIIGSAVAIQDISRLKESEILNQALNEIQQVLHSKLDVDAVMQNAVSVAGRALGSETAAISLRKDHHWVISYVDGFSPEVIGTQMDDAEERHATLAIQSQKPVAINDAFTDERCNQEHMRQWGVRSVLVIPILLRGEATGVIFFNYQSHPFQFQEYHLLFGINLAASISLALENARLFTSLEHEIQEYERIEQSMRSSERQLQESERKYRELVQYAPAAIYEIDFKTRRFTAVNEAMTVMSGYSREELLEMDPMGLLDEGSRQLFQERINQWLAGKKPDENVEYRILTKDGSELYTVLNVTFIRDEQGQPLGATVIGHDITERKRVETLRQQSSEAVREYSQRLEKSNQELQEFAFTASHDLQEPLRKIEAFGNLLLRSANPALGETERDYIERMRNATQRMRAMIDALLDLSRVLTEAKPAQRIDLNQVGRMVLDDLGELIDRTRGEVRLGELEWIQADPIQMQLLLLNLIGNGLKFHKPGAPPLVSVQGEIQPEGWLEIRVEDNGIGFTMEEASYLFKPFHRLRMRDEYEGTGMGLSICRKIVERHGGEIRAESEPGKGSVFIVRLPRE